MLDLNNRDSIYSAIKLASGDNSKVFALAQEIRTSFRKQGEEIKREIERGNKGVVVGALDSLTLDATDSEIRAGARALLISKLKQQEITAAEFAQFKDVFGLASAADQTSIVIESFSETVIDCPVCGANVYAPITGQGEK